MSQPCVVRMFDMKEQLFLDVLGRALDQLTTTFRAAIAGDPALPLGRRLGEAYSELTASRGILLCLMHAFALGADPGIGPAARCGFLDVNRLLRDEGGMTAEEAVAFLSGGMLANVVLGVRMFGDVDVDTAPDAPELLTEVFPDKLALIQATHPALIASAPVLRAGAEGRRVGPVASAARQPDQRATAMRPSSAGEASSGCLGTMRTV